MNGTRRLVRSRRGPFALALCVLGFVLLTTLSCTELKRRAYASGDRDDWQQPEAVVEVLGIRPGDQVADIGSGGGYFTFRLADAVGSDGKVYAVDVDADMNEALEEDVRERGYTNVAVVLGEYHDPLLPEGVVDLIFTSNTYHHLEDRNAYFAGAAKYLDDGGRVAIIEYKRHGLLQRWFGHATSEETMREEMEAAGYRLEKKHDFLDRQHFLIFAR